MQHLMQQNKSQYMSGRIIGQNSAKFLLLLSAMLLALSIASCSLIANHDPHTNSQLVILQSEVNTIFESLDKNFDTKKSAYGYYKKDYEKIDQRLTALISHASAISLNKETSTQLITLKDTLARLQKLHKIGFKRRSQITTLQKAVNSQLRMIRLLETKKSLT